MECAEELTNINRNAGKEDASAVLVNGYRVRPGMYLTNGATVTLGGVCFTIHSRGAVFCELVLFHPEEEEPYAVIPYPECFRIGNVYSMIVYGIDPDQTEYAYRLDGPYQPEKGLLFDKTKLILDPYARLVAGQHIWGKWEPYDKRKAFRGKIVHNSFDWGENDQPHLDFKDLIIYELHVRGFTKHPSAEVKNPGTFEGIREKIGYFKELGINAVELMPIFEFDECRDDRMVNGERLLDYWGYNTVCYFAPNSSYACAKNYNGVDDELKTLIRELHENGIEVILDVVFNHTAEGNENGPYISFKGLDNNIYYLLTPEGYYYNFSGCGNTLNCNNPIVNDLIIQCLRYWVTAYRIDGFRFDLASILGRNEDGSPMSKPPLLERLAYDPILGSVKLIAEAWDAGGLYQVGSFPSWGRWSEWNGKYRDDLRRFLKGDAGLRDAVAQRIIGSPDLYDPVYRGDDASVNFLTCHDGFTLADLYSYNQKHNEANGWNNTDGDNNGNSWNCGAEGDTDDSTVLALRRKLIKNAATVLLCSMGTPMLLSGDEFGNSQRGNNNAYCQDNEISWLDWTDLEKHADIYRYFTNMIALRKAHPILRDQSRAAACGFPLTSFHGTSPWELKNSEEERVLGVLFAGRDERDRKDDILYLGMNMHWEAHEVILPQLPEGLSFRVIADTSKGPGQDFLEEPSLRPVVAGQSVRIEPRSIMLLEGTAGS